MNNNKKDVNIAFVAKSCGVSSTTISRYLNGKFEYMSVETKERIEKVIEDLNYRPNAFACNLKTKKSGLVGIVLDDIANHFCATMVKGMIDQCVACGYQPLIASMNDHPESERKSINLMLENRVEGLIVTTTGNNDKFLEKLNQQGTPIVLSYRSIRGNLMDTVTVDIEKTVSKAVEALFAQGFEVIAFFSHAILANSSRIRQFRAFAKTVRTHVADKPLVYVVDGASNSATACMEEFAERYKGKRKAIFASDTTLLEILQAAKMLHWRIPEDIGVIGYDDFGWGQLVGEHGVPVIHHNVYEIGKVSAEILLERLNETEAAVAPRYIELESSIELP